MQLTVVSFNASRLGVERGAKKADDSPETLAKRRAAAEALRVADGDVVALQEVRSEASLERFVEEQELDEDYPHRHFFKSNDGGGHHQGLLSKFPIRAVENHRDEVFARGVGEADIQVGPYPVRFYQVHFKADPYYADNPTAEEIELATQRRNEETQTLLELMRGDQPIEHFVAVGDWNDTPQSESGQALVSAGLVDCHEGTEELSHPASGRRLDRIYASTRLAEGLSEASLEAAIPDYDHRPVKATFTLI